MFAAQQQQIFQRTPNIHTPCTRGADVTPPYRLLHAIPKQRVCSRLCAAHTLRGFKLRAHVPLPSLSPCIPTPKHNCFGRNPTSRPPKFRPPEAFWGKFCSERRKIRALMALICYSPGVPRYPGKFHDVSEGSVRLWCVHLRMKGVPPATKPGLRTKRVPLATKPSGSFDYSQIIPNHDAR